MKRCVALAGSVRCGCRDDPQPLAWCSASAVHPPLLGFRHLHFLTVRPALVAGELQRCRVQRLRSGRRGVSVSFLVVPPLVAPRRGVRSLLGGEAVIDPGHQLAPCREIVGGHRGFIQQWDVSSLDLPLFHPADLFLTVSSSVCLHDSIPSICPSWSSQEAAPPPLAACRPGGL